jgi:hypothetical protein
MLPESSSVTTTLGAILTVIKSGLSLIGIGAECADTDKTNNEVVNKIQD